MPVQLDSILDIAEQFEAVVLDQWGVLHDGTNPYPDAIETLQALRSRGLRLAVLSNSGKRAEPNLARIASMGFDGDLFETVMTSGEALWQSFEHDRLTSAGLMTANRLFAIERSAGDAKNWAHGLDLAFVSTLVDAEAILLMGLPDGPDAAAYGDLFEKALQQQLPVYCSNPDRASPRADGVQVISPGELAHRYADRGGNVTFYGKPFGPVFRAVERSLDLPADKLLMVGDSLAHDILGGADAGWSTLFIRGGLYRAHFSDADANNGSGDKHAIEVTLRRLAKSQNSPLPNYMMRFLK